MDIIKAKFIEAIKRTPTVESFRFRPEERIIFQPGQFLQIIFDSDNTTNKELNKYLSFSCAPWKEYIEVTKRISMSPFSCRLKDLKKGQEILVRAPLGSCVFKEEYKKIAFLAGGIGITPIISMLEYIAENNLPVDAWLAYSNRSEEEIAFKNQICQWAQASKDVKTLFLVTDCQPLDKTCIFGYINKSLLDEKIKDFAERTVFIFGPPRMVESMKGLCLESGCSQENIKSESFIGY